MLRGQKVFFRASKGVLDRLYACNRESARVWNEYLRLTKEHGVLDHQKRAAKSNEKEVPSSQRIDSSSLPQISLRKTICSPRDSTRTCCPLPYKKKKYFPTKCAKDGFKVYENGKIELSMGIHH
jgi:putative transposase